MREVFGTRPWRSAGDPLVSHRRAELQGRRRQVHCGKPSGPVSSHQRLPGMPDRLRQPGLEHSAVRLCARSRHPGSRHALPVLPPRRDGEPGLCGAGDPLGRALSDPGQPSSLFRGIRARRARGAGRAQSAEPARRGDRLDRRSLRCRHPRPAAGTRDDLALGDARGQRAARADPAHGDRLRLDRVLLRHAARDDRDAGGAAACRSICAGFGYWSPAPTSRSRCSGSCSG